MTKVLVMKSLQSVVVAYIKEANDYDEMHAEIKRMISDGQNFGRYLDPASRCTSSKMEDLDGEYQRICARFHLYERFGLPHFLDDLRRHVLLVDEIINGTLFLS